MSILWIDDILFEEKDGKRELRDTSIFVYANILSVLFTIIYAYFYKSNPQLHKAPNNLTMLKIMLLGLVSFHLLILFAAVKVEDNTNDYDTVNFFVKLTVTFSPVLVFGSYYIHASLAHNIYNTYYDYRKSYEKRVLFYSYSLIFLSVILYLLTIFDLDFNHSIKDRYFSMILYKHRFILIFYCVGLGLIGYVIHGVYFINVKQRGELLTLNVDDPTDTLLKKSASQMVKRYLLALLFFSISFLPNNVMMIVKYAFLEGEFNNYYFTYISTLMISLNAFVSCLVKFSDPYLRKIIRNYFRKEDNSWEEVDNAVRNFGDLKEMLAERGNNLPIELENLKMYGTYKTDQAYFTVPHSNPMAKSNNYVHAQHLNLDSNKNNLMTTRNDFHKEVIELREIEPQKTRKKSEDLSDIRSVISIQSDNVVGGLRTHHLTIEGVSANHKFLGNSRDKMRKSTKTSYFFSNEGDRTFDLFNFHLEYEENIYRMIGVSISINQDRIYDKENFYKSKYDSPLPWPEEKYYLEKTKLNEYRQDNLPDWVSIKYDKRFKPIQLRIKKYAPLVFHHIRLIDKISIDDCIKSLDPILNLEKIKDLRVSGGNSRNAILYTWDRKMLVKTISKKEKTLLMKEVLKNYHVRMRDTKSLLCRVYGVYRIGVSDQCDTYVLIMKNMCELPLETKILNFDLKGSSVNRDCISNSDKNVYEDKEELMGVYKNRILKDNDLRYLDIKFNLSSSDAKNLITAVEKDSYFLEKYWITDYSLLLAIHKFKVEDYRINFKNLRVLKSSDNKYLFSFSIIDFLTTYNFEKKGEKITKNIASIVKMAKDKNFSVQDPKNYGIRFRNFIKGLIQIDEN